MALFRKPTAFARGNAMSSEAVRAVRSKSKFNSADTWPEIQALLEIAEYANPQGVTGIAGNKRKCISLNRLADVADVHRNSIMPILERLKEAGELDWEKHGNHGRAIHFVFKILLPIEEIQPKWSEATTQNNSTISTMPLESKVLMLESQLAQLAQQLAQLAQSISTISTEKSTISTMPLESKVHDTLDTFSLNTKGDTNAHMRVNTPPPDFEPDDFIGEEEGEIPFEIHGAADIDTKRAWSLSFDLVQCWCEEIARIKHPYLNGSPERNRTTYDDYHIPATRLIYKLDFDMQKAAKLLRDKRLDMIQANLSVRRLEPVVNQILEDFERKEIKQLFVKDDAGLTPITEGVY